MKQGGHLLGAAAARGPVPAGAVKLHTSLPPRGAQFPAGQGFGGRRISSIPGAAALLGARNTGRGKNPAHDPARFLIEQNRKSATEACHTPDSGPFPCPTVMPLKGAEISANNPSSTLGSGK